MTTGKGVTRRGHKDLDCRNHRDTMTTGKCVTRRGHKAATMITHRILDGKSDSYAEKRLSLIHI